MVHTCSRKTALTSAMVSGEETHLQAAAGAESSEQSEDSKIGTQQDIPT